VGGGSSPPAALSTGVARLIRAALEEPGPLLRLALFPYLPPSPPSPLYRSVEPAFAVLAALALLPTLLMPAWMLILGDTFASARVRRVHLVRGLAYSLPGAIAFLVGYPGVIVPLVQVRGIAGDRVIALVGLGLIVGFILYHGLWWYLFIRRYLRLPHASAVVGLMTVMSGLVLVIWVLLLHNRGYLQ
jgi:hypothetical protein